jgi:hypothetical protein
MRHETALRLIDELDAGQEPGLFLRIHLANCLDCARQAKLMRDAMCAYRKDIHSEARASEADRLLEERVMSTLRLTPPPKQDFAIGDWLFPAALILISICIVSFVKNIGFLVALFGPGYAFSLSLTLGIIFTLYSTFFIATHLDELEHFLEKRGLIIR